jgi:hypothetical protein
VDVVKLCIRPCKKIRNFNFTLINNCLVFAWFVEIGMRLKRISMPSLPKTVFMWFEEFAKKGVAKDGRFVIQKTSKIAMTNVSQSECDG